MASWYIFPCFGMLYQEKSGDPAQERTKLKFGGCRFYIRVDRPIPNKESDAQLKTGAFSIHMFSSEYEPPNFQASACFLTNVFKGCVSAPRCEHRDINLMHRHENERSQQCRPFCRAAGGPTYVHTFKSGIAQKRSTEIPLIAPHSNLEMTTGQHFYYLFFMLNLIKLFSISFTKSIAQYNKEIN
jgi:hypothetical protein